ncbi:helix-turn-helix domain-containing protein [Acinetobacter lwoffii]|uniref:helix-turn-helix domain-containing protein n=1 Tax=Acinetobacter lwoffii TaxID=28090 RepID=UPI00209AA12A|nr:helix-turn-helix domain-containing protein [Acinetobacter lwoffii]MCO8062143.1 helix-turn-helix domain-containing protein [Acinetobacter lwoffii]
MNTRIYFRASTKDQDAQRALAELNTLNDSLELGKPIIYVEHYTGTKLERPELNKLLQEANQAKHKRIQELLAAGNMTKDEIAKAVGCGVATVYRVSKH